MYRSGRYKYIASSYGATELYDLDADPAEQVDLACDQPDLTAALHADMDRWLGSFESRPGEREPDDIEAGLIDELRATGYRL